MKLPIVHQDGARLNFAKPAAFSPTPSDPVALEDRLEATRQWMIGERENALADALGDQSSLWVEAIDLHLATLDDAVEALSPLHREAMSAVLYPYGGKSPLTAKVDGIIQQAAARYADRRQAGSSESMNGALDYTAVEVINAVREALGFDKL